ncbi:cytochrome oxidase subunit II-like protein [Ophiocordyceps camponoti-floridani]|uniref:Cytochrome oxidase subunit II-like protein n=1 Tax=Ophiocordyceps camponoti-floridani TaxID=2030778 RepID=A0A8H4VHU3_9HYPO|nr:cytochrome oxidase subunit II-like protein [Ophiocordyceps camponoti-floridani]
MANLDNGQVVAAVVFFGIVIVATLATAPIYLRHLHKPLDRDGPRLVLVGYLLAILAWAIVGLIATVAITRDVSSCQVAVVFFAIFDQLARFLLEEFIFWTIDDHIRLTPQVFLFQGVFLARFVLGAVFVAVQRPQIEPVCSASTMILALAIVVLVADAVVACMLLYRAYWTGILRDLPDKSMLGSRSRALLLLILGLVVWTGLSIPMILGINSIELVFRLVLPAIGSLIVLGLLAIFRRSLGSSQPGRLPSYPFNRELSSRGISSSQSAKPLASDGSSFTDKSTLKEGKSGLPFIGQPIPQGVPTTAKSFEAPRSGNTGLQDGLKGGLKGGRKNISKPIPHSEGVLAVKVPTIDLATAAKMERERRERDVVETAADPSSNPMTVFEALTSNGMRNETRGPNSKESTMLTTNDDHGSSQRVQSVDESQGQTTSAQPSPGADTIRRRSAERETQDTFGLRLLAEASNNAMAFLDSPTPTAPKTIDGRLSSTLYNAKPVFVHVIKTVAASAVSGKLLGSASASTDSSTPAAVTKEEPLVCGDDSCNAGIVTA